MKHTLESLMGLLAMAIGALGVAEVSFTQSACLEDRVTAFDAGVFQSFGYGVAVHGDTALIGAQWDNDLGTESGSVYVFGFEANSPEIWVFRQKLLASDGGGDDLFGRVIAIDRDLAVIGAPGHVDADAAGTGTAFVFGLDPTTQQWIEEQELFASDGAWQDGFGVAVSLSGDVAVIGALLDDDNGANSGSAYVFRFDPETSTWIEEQKLLASDGAAGDGFGLSVAVSGDIAMIGASGHDDVWPDNPICNSGAAYVFRYDPQTSQWIEQQKLLASDAACGDDLGSSVSISDEAALIGAKGDDLSTGSAYVFRFDPKTSQWVEEQKLLASDPTGADQFGRAVAIDGAPGHETAVVGAWASGPGAPSIGAAYVFRYDPKTAQWFQQDMLVPDPNASSNFFGWSVALDGETTVIGAHGEDQQRGAAYIYNVAPNCNCPHDLDADGSVGASDLLALLASWGSCKGCPADFDGNGNVGASDLLALLANWGPCP